MELVRIQIQAPVDDEVWVIAVSPTSAAEDLSLLPYRGLARAISVGTPLMIVAAGPTSGQPVYYRFGQGSGMVDEGAVALATGTANRQAGVKFSGQLPAFPEIPNGNMTHLMHKVGSGGATATLRIWATG